jgi:TolB protein
MDADGSNQTNLTDDPSDSGPSDRVPGFSPNGRQIVFQSSRDGDFEVFVMGVNGSNQTSRTNNEVEPSASSGMASWVVISQLPRIPALRLKT